MPDSDQTKKWLSRGAIFQFPMIILWGLRGLFFMGVADFSWENVFEFDMLNMSDGFQANEILMPVGFVLMIICMQRIYAPKPKGGDRKLITSDVFAITRHPMYHGMYLVDLGLFFMADLSDPIFWASWVVFTFLIFAAGWHQEKETLARWGEEAERYYHRTPRFAFEWLWFWARRPHA